MDPLRARLPGLPLASWTAALKGRARYLNQVLRHNGVPLPVMAPDDERCQQFVHTRQVILGASHGALLHRRPERDHVLRGLPFHRRRDVRAPRLQRGQLLGSVLMRVVNLPERAADCMADRPL